MNNDWTLQDLIVRLEDVQRDLQKCDVSDTKPCDIEDLLESSNNEIFDIVNELKGIKDKLYNLC